MMEAKSVTILERQRTDVDDIANLGDFVLGESHTVPSNVVLEPNFSLYCLDAQSKLAIFVDLPANIDLSQAPFVYQAQFEHAQRLILVPYQVFIDLADTLIRPERLILLYSTGRCGSTLLHTAFNQLEHVVSFSEHDAITQFIHLRDGRHHTTAELDELFEATVRFVCKATPSKPPQIHVLKLRNQCIEIMDLFHRLFPQSCAIFLYRNALDWVRSLYRLASRHGPPPDHVFSEALKDASSHLNRDLAHFKTLFDDPIETISITQLMTLWWLGVMESYLYGCDHNIPVKAWRYEDLNDFPQATLESISSYCHLPQSRITQALKAFDRDSQEGTWFARADKSQGNRLLLTGEQQGQMAAILDKHPIINHTHFLAPHTQIVKP